MKLVIDEWLWADLWGENGRECQSETLAALQNLFYRCDMLVAVRDSPFWEKFWMMAKEARTDAVRRFAVKFFRAQFLWNAEKLELLDECQLAQLPAHLEGQIKDDDLYLVRAYYASCADFLITTDEPLIEALSAHDVKCQHRAEFVRKYR